MDRRAIRRMLSVLVVFLATSALGFAQEEAATPARTQAIEAEERLRLAVSSIDYPVTPGDIYRLSYYKSADTLVTTDLSVDAADAIDLGIFGKIDGGGLQFTEVKERIEELIAKSYSRSLPSLRIASPGVFRVSVRGELERVQYITAWGLTKLSDIVNAARGRYSSLRRVDVVSRSGRTVSYDLLKAMRLGAPGQDPYARPGDRIILHPATRTVELAGEVRHPGSYELVEGEGLRELVEAFGGGATPEADLERVRLDRSSKQGGSALYLTLPAAYASATLLEDGDLLTLPSRRALETVVWLDGAVSSQRLPREGREGSARAETAAAPARAEGAAPSERVSARFSHRIKRGQMLSVALFEVREAILPNADLSGAVIFRRGIPLAIDLSPLLTEGRASFDLPLEPDDTIFIPPRRSTVSVAGAVVAPGFFPYQPGSPATYYLSMAGGVDPERNVDGSYWIADPSGKHRKVTEAVMPGDRVYVPLNAPGYRLERSVPLLVALVTAALNTATLIFLLTR